MDVVDQAKEILQKERRAATDSMDRAVLEHLIGCCGKEGLLPSAILQGGKEWKKCREYIYSEAEKLANGGKSCAVEDAVVFQWAKDYYKMDAVAEARRKARGKYNISQCVQLDLYEAARRRAQS